MCLSQAPKRKRLHAVHVQGTLEKRLQEDQLQLISCNLLRGSQSGSGARPNVANGLRTTTGLPTVFKLLQHRCEAPVPLKSITVSTYCVLGARRP